MTQMEKGSHVVLEPRVEWKENLSQRAIVILQTPLSLMKGLGMICVLGLSLASLVNIIYKDQ